MSSSTPQSIDVRTNVASFVHYSSIPVVITPESSSSQSFTDTNLQPITGTLDSSSYFHVAPDLSLDIPQVAYEFTPNTLYKWCCPFLHSICIQFKLEVRDGL